MLHYKQANLNSYFVVNERLFYSFVCDCVMITITIDIIDQEIGRLNMMCVIPYLNDNGQYLEASFWKG